MPSRASRSLEHEVQLAGNNAASSLGHLLSLPEFPLYYTNMPSMRYNVRMKNNFRDTLSINVTLSIMFPCVRKNCLSYKRWETLGNAG